MNDLLIEMLNSALGWPGRMISGSKSGYRDRNPNNLVVFNSNICTDAGKIWFGDVDVTADLNVLCEAAKSSNSKFYVLYEMDGRFENEERPRIDRAIVTFFEDGTFQVRPDYQQYVNKTLLDDSKHRV
jgi:hypothetical protein